MRKLTENMVVEKHIVSASPPLKVGQVLLQFHANLFFVIQTRGSSISANSLTFSPTLLSLVRIMQGDHHQKTLANQMNFNLKLSQSSYPSGFEGDAEGG